MGLVELLENSAFAVWVRESPSIFAYTTFLALHGMGLAILVGLNWALAIRLLGWMPYFPLAPFRSLFKIMYLGFWVNALSGLALFMASASTQVASMSFWVKLSFIALAMVNLLYYKHRVFGRLSDAELNQPVVPAGSARHAWCAFLFWGGAIIAGRLIAYPGIIFGGS